MAKKTIEELRSFISSNMPSNSELLVKPFRTLFSYILDHLADIASEEELNTFMFKVFGTSNIEAVDLELLLQDEEFTGNTLTQYMLFIRDKKMDNPMGNPGNGYVVKWYGEPVWTNEYTGDDKLTIPNADGNWVITTNGNNYGYTNAAFIGANVGNTNVNTTAAGGLTFYAPWTMNTQGLPYNLTNLPNKSSDSNFQNFLAQNHLGQVASVNNPYNLLKSGLNAMTQAQAIELGQLFNGGSGSAGNMSVNLISPPIVEKIDSVEYILLRGTNLNLNAISKKIEILNASTSEVVYTIPDEHIQLYSDGLSLIFQYNPKDLLVGEYKIRLTSGSKVYVTTLLITCVANIQNINLDNITWELIYSEPVNDSGNNVAVGRNTYIESPVGSMGQNIVISVKSSELFAQGDDFYIELQLSTTINTHQTHLESVNTFTDYNKNFIGLGYSLSPNNFSVNSLISMSQDYWGGGVAGVGGVLKLRYHSESTLVKEFYHNQTPGTINVVIVKTGNLFRIVTEGFNISKTLSNNSGYSLFLNIVKRSLVMQSTSIQIVKAFKFN